MKERNREKEENDKKTKMRKEKYEWVMEGREKRRMARGREKFGDEGIMRIRKGKEENRKEEEEEEVGGGEGGSGGGEGRGGGEK